jgi:threonine aldolase
MLGRFYRSFTMSTYGVQYSRMTEEEQKARNVSDFRSDTVTVPSKDMYAAMMSAPVGDDVYGEDPTTSELEATMAAMLGKEAGLFCASGTMSNLLAILTHCELRGSEALVGSLAHINILEQGGAATIGGVHLRSLPNKTDGTFSLDDFDANVRDASNIHYAQTRVVCVENTHNVCGGRILPLEWLADLRARATRAGVAVHMDGARVCNAAVALGVPLTSVAADVDTVSVCVSKGLGAPVGAVLCGSADFIRRAHRTRKAIGGGMRQAGVIAAGALYALRHNVERMAEDHARARTIGEAVATIPGLTIDMASVETNLVFFALSDALFAAGARASDVMRALEQDHGVRVIAMTPRNVRAATHLNVNDDDVAKLIAALKVVMAQLCTKHSL